MFARLIYSLALLATVPLIKGMENNPTHHTYQNLNEQRNEMMLRLIHYYNTQPPCTNLPKQSNIPTKQKPLVAILNEHYFPPILMDVPGEKPTQQTTQGLFLKLDYNDIFTNPIDINPTTEFPTTKIPTETPANKRTFSQFSSKAGSSIKFRKITFEDETICYPNPPKNIQKITQINSGPSKQSNPPVQKTKLTTPTTSAIQDCINQPATNPNKLNFLIQLLNTSVPQVTINYLMKSKDNTPSLFTQIITKNSDQFVENILNDLCDRIKKLKIQAKNLCRIKLLSMVQNGIQDSIKAKNDPMTLMLNKIAQELKKLE
ncbi:TPA: hypothetical protein DDZ86_01595 [Candidatus Dependentiae bacterium]|nr:MAG: hypothetical protein UW09_C0001G0317 [candidate division TM6 bacterium GW2011_GWF2_43_87]HBL98318.1 hypothetical protein [Candidatus Dependentiae bacterium]